MTRTLPIRVAPVPGEALDSWLESVSARLDTPLRTLIKAFGLARYRLHNDFRAKPPDWTICLEPAEARQLSAVTGVSTHALHAMTLQRWHPQIVHLDLARRTIRRNKLWTALGSRFCPACLNDTNGRWQLNWRLTWTFACTIHQQLLADVCPHCQRKPRTVMSPLYTVATPSLCAMPEQGATTSLVTPRCAQPLTSATTASVTGEIIAAQHTLHQLIADPSAHQLFPLYPAKHFSTPQLLQDLKVIAAKVLNYATDADLGSFADASMIAAMRGFLHNHGGRRPGAQPPRDAATVAIGLTFALHVLQAPDHAAASDRIRWLVRRSTSQDAIALTDLRQWQRHISPTLHGILAAPAIQNLSAAGKLAHRAATRPARPENAQTAAGRARNLPAALWPRWALQLTPVGTRRSRNTAQAFAVCLLRVGTRINLPDAIDLLRPTTANPKTVHHLLNTLTAISHGEAIMQTITHLAEVIDRQAAPIDYHRRRTTFGAQPPQLTQRQWQTITGGPDPGSDFIHAQRWLYEQLTGSLAEAAPQPLTLTPQHLASYYDFTGRLSQNHVHALKDIASKLLADHHIDEPLTWTPQLAMSSNLPGPHPDSVTAAQVHRLQLSEQLYPRQIAHRLNTTIEHIQYLQQENPMPATSTDMTWRTQPEQWAYWYTQLGWGVDKIATTSRTHTSIVRAALVSAGITIRLRQFRYLHLGDEMVKRHQERETVTAISQQLGIGWATTKRILRHKGIDYPDQRSQPRYEHLKAEIIRRYTTETQPIKYIAKDLGVSEGTIARYLRTAGIARRIGANSHLTARKGHPNETQPFGHD